MLFESASIFNDFISLSMPKKDGLCVVKEIIAFDSKAKMILITASDDQKIIQ